MELLPQAYMEYMKMKLEILKLKADDYNWACHIHDDTKKELEGMLAEINEKLAAHKAAKEQG